MAEITSIQTALIEVRKGLRIFKALEFIEQAGAKIEASQQNEAELLTSIASLRVKHAETMAVCEVELTAQASRLADAKMQATQAEAVATREAEKILADAESRANSRTAAANDAVIQAEAVVERARADAIEAEAARNLAKAELADLDARRKALSDSVADLLAKVNG
jgi:membrane protein involved in colicin uptake